MIQPVEYEVGTTIVNTIVDNILLTEREKVLIECIPLKWSLKILLEIPGMFELLKKYMSVLENEPDIISNFIQGKLWKKMSENFEAEKLVIPLFVYYDEFETGNALGSHAGMQKIGGVYTQVPCFPPHITSRLSNIVLTSLFYANDRKTFGNKVFQNLIKELNELNTDGLFINVDKKEFKIHFQLALMLGDNLGLNEILGFTGKFSSGRPCRICSASINEIKDMISENKNLLGTVKSYDEDCQLNKPSDTGINEPCVFNNVLGFHVCINVILDIMHDIFEGAANDTMANILQDLIYKQNLFSLEFLNHMLSSFPYGSLESSNQIPLIKKEHIQKNKKLKMSSSEMMCFTRYFSLLVGDKVKKDNTSWKLYIMLRKIIAIVTSPRLVMGHIYQLEILISDFLSLYKFLYGHLKYKFHNMTHLANILISHGPAVHYWSMRFESKHREHKLTAVTTSNKKNLLKTISIKSLLRLGYMKIANSSMYVDDKLFYQNHRSIDEQSRRKYFPSCELEEEIISTNHVSFKGIDYKDDMIFVTEMGDNDLLEFGKIIEIFVRGEHIHLLMQPLSTLCFNEHFYAYHVKERNVCVLKNIFELPNIHQCLSIKKQNSLFVATRYKL